MAGNMDHFEVWNSIGLKQGVELIKSLGYKPTGWINKMIQNGVDKFYSVENGNSTYYDLNTCKFKIKPGYESFIILKIYMKTKQFGKIKIP